MRDQIVEIIRSISSPIGERNLAKRLNTSYRHIRWICRTNPDTFERSSPLDVGSNKYDYSRQTTHSIKNRVRRPLRVWRLRN